MTVTVRLGVGEWAAMSDDAIAAAHAEGLDA